MHKTTTWRQEQRFRGQQQQREMTKTSRRRRRRRVYRIIRMYRSVPPSKPLTVDAVEYRRNGRINPANKIVLDDILFKKGLPTHKMVVMFLLMSLCREPGILFANACAIREIAQLHVHSIYRW